MANSFDCPNCGQKLTAKPEMAGVIIDCPSCGSQIQVPAFEAPVTIAPQPSAYPPSAIPQRFQNPYGQQIDGPQLYPQQIPMQQPYGYQPQPTRKSNMGGVVALIITLVLVAAGVVAYFVFRGKNTSIVVTEKDKVVQVVNAVLEENKRGEWGKEYWVDWKQDSLSQLFTPTSWDVLSVEYDDKNAKVLFHADSSNRAGVKVSTLWIMKLSKEYGKWKVYSLDEKGKE
jgi:DNA-directed RNA polymerase subunit RPC12/RpoP